MNRRAAEPTSRQAGEPASRRAAEPPSRRVGEPASRRAGIRLVQVSHIKGDAMISAGVDALSRPPKFARKCEADRDDWQLTGAAFEAVQAFSQEIFGGTTMDRMASRANRQVQRFSSVSSVDPDAESFSAFATDWAVSPTGEQEISYCFPPFSFIPRVLQHVQQCKAKAVIIVPEWPSQA